jgi:hypothetical protein
MDDYSESSSMKQLVEELLIRGLGFMVSGVEFWNQA